MLHANKARFSAAKTARDLKKHMTLHTRKNRDVDSAHVQLLQVAVLGVCLMQVLLPRFLAAITMFGRLQTLYFRAVMP